MDNRTRIDRRSAAGLYHGWRVVAAAFLVAMFGFGLGFYGPGIYLVALEARHGWSVAELSPAVTAYYVLGATLLFFCVGPLFERQGSRKVVVTGAVALAGGLVLLASVTKSWQVYAAFALMSVGWATMSGAAINIIVAPWFDQRRGQAVSWALNGASAGGIVAPPLLTFLIARVGFVVALDALALAMLAILVPVVVLVLRGKRAGEHDLADAVPALSRSLSAQPGEWHLVTMLRNQRFITISVAFALGLTAQVGFLTHQVAFLTPTLGAAAAGWAVSMTTLAAVLGRIAAGYIADRIDRRRLASANFAVQLLGMGILATAPTAAMLYLGCVLFGLGLGNTTSLPGLIVQHEFPNRHFARIISLVVAINQFSFAFGPAILGLLQHARASYTDGLLACAAMEAIAAVIVILPAIERSRKMAA
jgi:MFS family permease